MYEALYRKWRPLTFDDVISQNHVTQTLKNQIIHDQTAHAYIFTGSRGTGKTTCARIFAKALNCLSPKDGNPCLECEICRNAGRLADIIEIDAASNNGVESIREIRDGLEYMPQQCRYKVYIIDEVHMLSNQAFNAFLKSIEEPPAYVKFIFATTEIHKVPSTILSRCQRFDFRRVRTADIAQRLKYIISCEGLSITDDAALLIGKISDGGMRDALSLLDLCSSVSGDITADVVSAAAGIADRKYIFSLLEALFKKDMALAMKTLNDLYIGSADLCSLSCELTEQMRNAMLLKLSPPQKESVSCTGEEAEKITEISSAASLDEIMDMLRAMQSCTSSMNHAANKRAEFEMTLVSLISSAPLHKEVKGSPRGDSAYSDSKIADLERRLNAAEQKLRLISSSGSAPVSSAPPLPEPDAVDFSKLKKEDFHPVSSWAAVLEKFREYKPDVVGALEGSAAFINGSVMLVVTGNPFFIHLFKNKENAETLRRVIYETLGKNYIIKAKCTAKSETQSPAQRAKEFLDNAQSSGIDTAVENGV